MVYCTIDVEARVEDFDAEGNIKASRVLSWFQDAAAAHTRALNVSGEDIIKDDLMWVLTKCIVEKYTKLEPGKKYKCVTFHVSQKSVTFKRDYYITEYNQPPVEANDGSKVPDMSGALIKGTSQWCIMHYSTRKLAKSGLQFGESGKGSDALDVRFPKIKGSDPQYAGSVVVSEADIDFNDHCNNTKYIDFAVEATGKPARERVYVNYASETRLGDEIRLFSEETDEGIYVEGRTSDDAIVFQTIYK